MGHASPAGPRVDGETSHDDVRDRRDAGPMSGLLDRLLGRTEVPAVVVAAPEPEEPTGRRDRLPGSAESQIEERIGEKVLHGWLQNRQQTLMPLSVNLGRLAPADRIAAMRFAAVAALAGHPGREPAPPASAQALEAWLVSVGASEDAVAVFRSTLERPPALHEALAAVRGPDLAPLAFVTALVAGRDGDGASRAFADYVAASLALPSTAIRSAERRFRF